MNEIERIADQLKRTVEGPAWHGPAVLEVLDGVTADQAAAKPVLQAHSIWEILLHIISGQELVLGRLYGGAGSLSPQEDWPPVSDPAPAAWVEAVKALRRSHSELQQALLQVGEQELEREILPGYSTVYVTLHGLIQHNVYHAGQIALLKKAGAGVEK
jgi:uncharacterized damage-inducible protein DinB